MNGGSAEAATIAAAEAVVPGAAATREGRPMEAHYSRIEATGVGMIGTQPIRIVNDIARSFGKEFADLDPSIVTQFGGAVKNTASYLTDKITGRSSTGVQHVTLNSMTATPPAVASPPGPSAPAPPSPPISR
jgi:hypothetical protein